MSNGPTLVVSCTDRKATVVGQGPSASQLPEDTLEANAGRWTDMILRARDTGPTLPLRDLYQGEYWSVVRNLEPECDVWVASAGLGMRTMDSDGVAYRATFSPGSMDSISRLAISTKRETANSIWWKCIGETGLGNAAWLENVRDVVLVAVSSHYQEAMADDLIRIAKSGRTVVVLSGSPPVRSLRDIGQIVHVETGQWIRMILGGSTPSVGIRFTDHVVKGGAWEKPDFIRDVMAELEKVYHSGSTDKLPKLNRRLRSDDEVREWIKSKMMKHSTRPSKSAFLRLFRSEGFACEQERFGRLFDEIFQQ